jgi:hypothetical protein
VVGRPRCSRISFTIFFSDTKASTTRRPPQGQRSTSSRKTRSRSSAPGMRDGPAGRWGLAVASRRQLGHGGCHVLGSPRCGGARLCSRELSRATAG